MVLFRVHIKVRDIGRDGILLVNDVHTIGNDIAGMRHPTGRPP